MNESGILAKTIKSGVERLRVMFVDDNAPLAKLMAETAAKLGHHAGWASTEAEARTLLQSEDWDGLITDYSLDPEKVQGGGARLAAMLHSGSRSVPCIVITGFSPVGELATVTSVLECLGNVIVLHKPQDPSSLMNMLKSLIDAKAAPPVEPLSGS